MGHPRVEELRRKAMTCSTKSGSRKKTLYTLDFKLDDYVPGERPPLSSVCVVVVLNHFFIFINHQSSIINHQSSIINHQSSIINHQSFQVKAFFEKRVNRMQAVLNKSDLPPHIPPGIKFMTTEEKIDLTRAIRRQYYRAKDSANLCHTINYIAKSHQEIEELKQSREDGE